METGFWNGTAVAMEPSSVEKKRCGGLFAQGAVWFILVAAGVSSSARAVHVVAGPMVGSVTPTSARVWIEINTSERVRVRCFDVNTNQEMCSIGMTVPGPPPFVVNAPLGGLLPDHDYRMTLTANGLPLRLPPPSLIIHTPPAPGANKDITLAFGSCVNTDRYPSRAIWRSIVRVQPRAFIFAGNTVYLPRKLSEFPYTYEAARRFIEQRYDEARRFAGFQRLLRTCPIYATWDDRDFGTPHSDASFVFAQESLIAFERYWPNPGYGTGHTLGTFCRFSIGDVAVFLLDDRTFRRPPAKNRPGTMFGSVQLAWLKRHLLASRADFKLIVDGDPMLPDYPGPSAGYRDWAHFGNERSRFIHWIFGHDVSGVIFLSGHRRFGELTLRQPDPNSLDQYPLYELTSSSLAARPVSPAQMIKYFNTRRVGAPVLEHNFGVISVGGPAGNRHIMLRLCNAHGKTVLSKMLLAGQLTGN